MGWSVTGALAVAVVIVTRKSWRSWMNALQPETNVIGSVLLLSFPSKRFRCTWMAIDTHSGQSVFFVFLILGIVLGLA